MGNLDYRQMKFFYLRFPPPNEGDDACLNAHRNRVSVLIYSGSHSPTTLVVSIIVTIADKVIEK